MNIEPIEKHVVSVGIVAQSILNDADKIDEIFCVAFTKDGDVFQYHCGKASGAALAALVLQEVALRASKKP